MSLRFFADHCVPAVVIRLLRDHNHEVLAIKREHVMTIDGLSADPDIELAVAIAGYYGINDARANEIVDNTRAIVSTWKERAQAGERRR